MEELFRRLERRQRRHRVACYVFIAAVGILYATNIIMRAAVHHDSVWVLLRDFLLPLVIAAGIYVVDWNNNYSTSLIYTHIPKVKLLVVCAPIVAAFMACTTYEPHKDTVDFWITILAMTSMYIAPYALRNVQRACIAIVVQAFGFVILAAYLGNNSAAIVTIAFTALVLICCLPKLDWFNRDEENINAKVTVALVTLIAGLLLLLLIEGTGVLEAIFISSLGRPGLGYSAFLNQQCANMLTEARFVGPVSLDYPVDGLFADRVLTYILAQGGWLAVIPILLAIVLMITSGIYLCRRSIAIQYYISVSFMSVITIQSIGYLLMCAGWDELLFPELSPFLAGGFHLNTLFFLMAICILPPKQKGLSESRSNSTNADEDDEDYLDLDELDINSPTYEEDLEKALAHLPRTKEAMEQLWSHVRYSDELSSIGWELLLTEYEEFMDEEFYEMVVTRLRTTFDKENFKDSSLWWLFP